ncbi:unnamed protein product [Mycena citricolor]|uniref:NADP-dependent oxidoreductase domain-containing protein n=1 Tax=Mycena citricolor TaxID=2018698 RepID=A0AAD2GQX2_9AGAR|nr:unnamed protein product [Mycena citricolor]
MAFGSYPLNDGREIPAIAFGTGSIYKWTDVSRLVEQALEAGFWHLDTAQEYVGKVIHESGLSRSELYVTTKYSGIGDMRSAIESSLSSLGLKYVDLYLMHQPFPNFAVLWKEFEAIQKEGFAKSIGVSNFTLPHFLSLVQNATVWPSVNQIEFHPYTYAKYKETIEWTNKHGIVTEAYSSLSPITKFPGGPVDKPVSAAAARLGITPTQVLLLWVRAKGVVIVTTTSNKDRLKEYLAVGDLPPLSDEEVAAIDAAGAKGPPRFNLGFLRSYGSRAFMLILTLIFIWGIQMLVSRVY